MALAFHRIAKNENKTLCFQVLSLNDAENHCAKPVALLGGTDGDLAEVQPVQAGPEGAAEAADPLWEPLEVCESLADTSQSRVRGLSEKTRV